MANNTFLTASIDRSGKPDDMATIMSYKPSTLETIDAAVYGWLDDKMNISCTTNKGWKKVPVIWVAGERSWQIKNNKNLRDSDGALIFPMMTLQRDGFSKDPSKKGMFYGNIPHVNDPKGASITIARRVQQDKTANFANADAYRKKSRLRGNAGNPGAQQINFPMPKNKKVVYETITIPMPVYIEVNYTISARTEYQQQMNEVLQPFATTTQGINYLVLKQDGHSYETFMQSDFSSENNVTDLGDETRIYESKVTLKVLGYLIGANKNDEQPHIVIRENAVDIKSPRERVVMGDEPDWGPIGTPKGKYRS
tara:strand:- start:7299 stop:8228 length:930 start_codon:yes stop_codon:yes gene_type:complete